MSIHGNPQPRQSFRFTTSAGAEAYRLRVYLDDDDSEVALYDVTRPVDSCALTTPSSGLVEWSFDNACVDAEEPQFWEWATGDGLRWTVDALRADSSRRAATDGSGFASSFYYQSDYLLSGNYRSPWPIGFYIDMRLESQGIEPADQTGEPPWFSYEAFKGLESGVISVNGEETEAWVEYYYVKTSIHELDQSGTRTIRVDVGDVPFATNYIIAFDDAGGFAQGVVDTHVFPHPYFLFASPAKDEVRLIIWPMSDDTMTRVPTVLRIFTDWTFIPEVPDNVDDDNDADDEPDCWDESEIPVALPPVGLPKLVDFSIPGTIYNFEVAEQQISMMVPWQSALDPERASGAIPTRTGTSAIVAFNEPAGTTGYVAYVSSNQVDFVERSVDLRGRTTFTADELPATPLNGYSYHFALIVPHDECGQFAKVGPDSIGVFAFARQ